MKRLNCVVLQLFFILGFAVLALGQQVVPRPLAYGFNSIHPSDLRADVAFLASDALQGRQSLRTGDAVAIQWIASEFAKAGLKPPANGSYLQPVDLIQYVPDRAQSYVALRRGGSEQHWKYPIASGVFPSDVDISGEVVFAGFGITAPGLHYDDYQGIDVRGKIVLVFDGEPQENDPASIFNGTGSTEYATPWVKVMNARAHGAVAMLLVARPNRNHPTARQRFVQSGEAAARNLSTPAEALADSQRIPMAAISDDVAKELFAGSGATPSAAQSVIDRDLKPQSRPLLSARVTLHFRNKFVAKGTSYNVAGVLEGSDPRLRTETVIISAHHDHDGMESGRIWHGADDNASGTTGVVALAHAIVANVHAGGAAPKRSILFVVFAAEERGLLGSFYMASHPLRPLKTTRAMINFDMIGRNESPSNQTNGLIDIPSDTSNRLNLIGVPYSPDYDRTIVQENKYVGLNLDDRFDRNSSLSIFFAATSFRLFCAMCLRSGGSPASIPTITT